MSSRTNTFESETGRAKDSKPLIGVTMGDPAGIGPEIVLEAAVDKNVLNICTPVIIGDLGVARSVAPDILDRVSLVENEIGSDDADAGKPMFLDLANVPAGQQVGVPDAEAGRASGEFIEKAVELCMTGQIDAVATAPINKVSFNAGGYDFPGHTEFLAHLTNTEKFAMAFFAGKLRVVLLSTHVSIREAIEIVKLDKLKELLIFVNSEFKSLLSKTPRIAVAGLNPHASEDGKFGTEEAAEMIPAITECREELGIDVVGPYSADTVFLKAFQGEFDAVVACYHDQATIAVKCLSFGEAVNVTLGLPIIRTSVDHGTAYDITRKGMADSGSMKAAIRLGAELTRVRRMTA